MSRPHRHTRHTHKQSRRTLSPKPILQTIQREDGLWQSIEADEVDLAPNKQEKIEPAKEDQSFEAHHDPPKRSAPCRSTKTIGTQTDPPPDAHTIVKTHERAPTPTRSDLIARILHCPFKHINIPPTPETSPATQQQEPTPPSKPEESTEQTTAPPTKKRGRPRKRHPAPAAVFNTHKRRVRFSDPAPSEAEPQLQSRDSRVFVRLIRVNLAVTNQDRPSFERTFAWNNRAKGWKPTGRGINEDFVDLYGLFGEEAALPMLRPLLQPTEGASGVRQSLEMEWDEGRYCYLGVNTAGERMEVALGEVRDMVRDPWARQFVGYILG